MGILIMENQEEIWKDVVGYEWMYQISTMGNVRNSRTGYVIKQKLNINGYPTVIIRNSSGKKGTLRVHRLIMIAFIDNPHNKPFVNHIDGDKRNNNINNLEWCTAKENSVHAALIGLCKKPWEGKFGKNHNMCKAVIQMNLNGDIINEFGAFTDAANSTNTCKTAISVCVRGINMTAGGYKWKYK